MSNYVPHYTKKKWILDRKESALQRLVDADAPADKLIAAAEDVRDARIRVLRAQRATIVPKDDAQILYAKIDDRIQAVRDTPITSILSEFEGAVDDDADVNGGD